MGLALQTIKKIGLLLLLGLFPLIIFLSGQLFRIDLPLVGFISIFSAFILVIIAHKITDSPFLQVWEGKKFGAWTFDSRGAIDFFAIELIQGNLTGEYEKKKIVVPFNQAFFFRFSQFFQKGTIESEGEELVLRLKKKEFDKSFFKTTYPTLLYSRQLGTFITKEWLHEQEKKAMLIALGYEVNRNIQEYNKSASSITRQIVDLIGSTLKKQSWLLWLLIIVILGYVIIQFGPQINSLITGSINRGASAVGGVSLPEKFG